MIRYQLLFLPHTGSITRNRPLCVSILTAAKITKTSHTNNETIAPENHIFGPVRAGHYIVCIAGHKISWGEKHFEAEWEPFRDPNFWLVGRGTGNPGRQGRSGRRLPKSWSMNFNIFPITKSVIWMCQFEHSIAESACQRPRQDKIVQILQSKTSGSTVQLQQRPTILQTWARLQEYCKLSFWRLKAEWNL